MRWEQKNHHVALDIGLGLRKHFSGISVSSQTPRHSHSGLVRVSDWVLHSNGSKFLLPNMSTAQTGCCHPSGQAKVIMQISPLATLGAKSRFKTILKPKKTPPKINPPCTIRRYRCAAAVTDEGSCWRTGRHSGASLSRSYRVRMQRPEYIKRGCRTTAKYQSWWQMCFKQIGINSSKFLSVVFKVATDRKSVV